MNWSCGRQSICGQEARRVGPRAGVHMATRWGWGGAAASRPHLPPATSRHPSTLTGLELVAYVPMAFPYSVGTSDVISSSPVPSSIPPPKGSRGQIATGHVKNMRCLKAYLLSKKPTRQGHAKGEDCIFERSFFPLMYWTYTFFFFLLSFFFVGCIWSSQAVVFT